MTRSFTFTNIKAGWIDAEIRTSGGVQAVDASYLSDAIRDFADALASLVTAPTATCRWEQEPGELEWNFTKSGDHLTVTVLLLLSGNRHPCFECSFRYRSFCKDMLDSLHDLKDAIGLPAFEKEWGYPFPAEASRKLENAIASNSASETT
jgi:hypothetical protein